MNISGILQVPGDGLTESQLEAILLGDISTYLNVSREFITIIGLPVRDTGSGSAANLTNGSHRLLYALPVDDNLTLPVDGNLTLRVDYNFTVLFQIPSGDEAAYAQLEKIVNDTKYAALTIADNNGYRVVLGRAKLLPGYFRADGNVLEPCADGQDWIADNVTETLLCPPPLPTPEPTPAPPPPPQGDWGGFVGLGAALLVGLVGILELRRRTAKQANAAGRIQSDPTAAAPATVTIEYHLVPVHLI
jgi:hypothetical protein